MHPREYGMLRPAFERRAFPVAAAKSQSQKLTLLLLIPQTFFLLQSRSAPKSVLVCGSPAKLNSLAKFDFACLSKVRRSFLGVNSYERNSTSRAPK
jgi:hypothetical protein